MARKMLVVAARGCDWEYGCGGTVLREVAAGGEARVIIVTNDMHAVPGKAPAETAQLRRAECEASAKAAGVDIQFLDLRTRWYWKGDEKVALDWRVYDEAELARLPGEGSIHTLLGGDVWRAVLDAMTDLRPDAVFTHPVSDIDQASIYAAHSVFYAASSLEDPELASSLRIYMWQSEAGRGLTALETDVLVDITSVREKKYELVACHASQADDGRLEAARLREGHWGTAVSPRRTDTGRFAEAFTLSRHKAEGLL